MIPPQAERESLVSPPHEERGRCEPPLCLAPHTCCAVMGPAQEKLSFPHDSELLSSRKVSSPPPGSATCNQHARVGQSGYEETSSNRPARAPRSHGARRRKRPPAAAAMTFNMNDRSLAESSSCVCTLHVHARLDQGHKLLVTSTRKLLRKHTHAHTLTHTRTHSPCPFTGRIAHRRAIQQTQPEQMRK